MLLNPSLLAAASVCVVPLLCMPQKHAKTVRAAVMILSMSLESCSADVAVRPEHKQCINKILEYIVALLPHHSIIAEARDAAISAIVKNAKRSDVAKRFVDLGGVRAMLVLASCTRSQLTAPGSEASAGIGTKDCSHV